MNCPLCEAKSRVVESRPTDAGAGVRRRRECESCEHRFTTFERREDAVPTVCKRDGRRQIFDPAKVRAGLERAAHKRQRAAAATEAIAAGVIAEATRQREISSRRIGELCLDGLRDADRIAYLRYASVHKQLADLDAIRAELSEFDLEVVAATPVVEPRRDELTEPAKSAVFATAAAPTARTPAPTF